MTGHGHTHTGIGISIAVYYGFYNYVTTNNMWISLISALIFIAGSTAPDWLEIRKKTGGTVINHRTITHWVPLWFLLAYLGWQLKITDGFGSVYFENKLLLEILYSSVLSFSLGGILHLITDLPNPMGVPVPTWKIRFSLKLWKSGKFEPQMIALSYVVSLFWIGLDTGFIIIDTSVLNI